MACEAMEAVLGDFIDFKNGKTSPERNDNGRFFVFGSNGVIGKSNEYNSPERSLIIGRVGSYCGSVYYSDSKSWITDNAIIGLPKNKNESEYWFFYLKSLELNSYRVGSGQPLINQSILKSIQIKIPESEEIRVKIGFILKNFDDKISLNTQTNQTLEALAQAIFKSWFVDFDPVKAKVKLKERIESEGGDWDSGLTEIAEELGLSEDVLALFPDEFEESELGLIPKGWSVVTLDMFGSIVCGKTPSKKEEKFYGVEFPFIKIPDMHDSVFVIKTNEYLSNDGHMSQKNKLIPKGSVCVSCIATVGKVSIASKDSHTNQQINSIVPSSETYTPYLYFKMLDSYKLLHNYASGGSATLNLNTGNFSKILVLKPTNSLLDLFFNRSKFIFNKMLLNTQQNQNLAQLRDTLLPKLLSGEITIEFAAEIPELTD